MRNGRWCYCAADVSVGVGMLCYSIASCYFRYIFAVTIYCLKTIQLCIIYSLYITFSDIKLKLQTQAAIYMDVCVCVITIMFIEHYDVEKVPYVFKQY